MSDTLSDRNQLVRFQGSLSAGADDLFPTVLSTSVVLDDAQVKALSGAPVEVIPAPGPGKMLIPMMSVWLADLSGGFYTGIPAYDPTTPYRYTLMLALDVNDNDQSPAGGVMRADALLGGVFASGPGKIIGWSVSLGDPGAQIVGPVAGGVVGGDNQVANVGSGFMLSRGFENSALSVQANQIPPLGGGGLTNKLTVTVAYSLLDVS